MQDFIHSTEILDAMALLTSNLLDPECTGRQQWRQQHQQASSRLQPKQQRQQQLQQLLK